MDQLISSFDQALNEQKKPLFVFDIDSTIFNVSPRNQAIFDLFKNIQLNEHLDLLNLLSNKPLNAQDWGLEPYFKELKSRDVPLEDQLLNFWRRHFFAGTFLHSDIPYPYAVEWIKRLAIKGAEIRYLTGRDHHRMRAGTLLQIKHWNLPLIEDDHLITKPHKKLLDGTYKRKELEGLLSKFKSHKVFFFDNEPAVLKHCFFQDIPNYKAIYVESTHSNRSAPEKQWSKINAFEYQNFLRALEG